MPGYGDRRTYWWKGTTSQKTQAGYYDTRPAIDAEAVSRSAKLIEKVSTEYV